MKGAIPVHHLLLTCSSGAHGEGPVRNTGEGGGLRARGHPPTVPGKGRRMPRAGSGKRCRLAALLPPGALTPPPCPLAVCPRFLAGRYSSADPACSAASGLPPRRPAAGPKSPGGAPGPGGAAGLQLPGPRRAAPP